MSTDPKDSDLMQYYVYSPLPRQAYYTDLEYDSIKCLDMVERGAAVWNLRWLTYPSIDKLPGAGKDWYLYHLATPAMCGALVDDVNMYDTLYHKLSEHPAKFAAWFAKEDHTGWACYKEGGGAKWVATVLERADQAAQRIASAIRVDGNVILVKFGK